MSNIDFSVIENPIKQETLDKLAIKIAEIKAIAEVSPETIILYAKKLHMETELLRVKAYVSEQYRMLGVPAPSLSTNALVALVQKEIDDLGAAINDPVFPNDGSIF